MTATHRQSHGTLSKSLSRAPAAKLRPFLFIFRVSPSPWCELLPISIAAPSLLCAHSDACCDKLVLWSVCSAAAGCMTMTAVMALGRMDRGSAMRRPRPGAGCSVAMRWCLFGPIPCSTKTPFGVVGLFSNVDYFQKPLLVAVVGCRCCAMTKPMRVGATCSPSPLQINP